MRYSDMNMIAAVDQHWAIGRKGGLLAHLPGDLKYYQEKTLGKYIVIGRKTLESFPGGKPLPGRENIVLTTDPSYRAEGCTICHSMEELDHHLSLLPHEDIFVSGGETIYRQMLTRCRRFYVTHIQEIYEEADAFFPDLSAEEGIRKTWQGEMQEEQGTRYYFAKYERI